MTDHDRLVAAARRILAGDNSMLAARALEAVLTEDYLGDERLEQLLYTLSIFSPADGPPYADVASLHREIIAGLGAMGQAHRVAGNDSDPV